jgi:hypothetical protein
LLLQENLLLQLLLEVLVLARLGRTDSVLEETGVDTAIRIGVAQESSCNQVAKAVARDRARSGSQVAACSWSSIRGQRVSGQGEFA